MEDRERVNEHVEHMRDAKRVISALEDAGHREDEDDAHCGDQQNASNA